MKCIFLKAKNKPGGLFKCINVGPMTAAIRKFKLKVRPKDTLHRC